MARQFRMHVFGVVLSLTSIAAAAASPPAPLSVRQFVAYAVEETSRAMAETCMTRYPVLKPRFTTVLAGFQRQAATAVDELLQAGQYKSLSETMVPQDLIDAYVGSTALIRGSGAVVTQEECAKAMEDMGSVTAEQMRATIGQMLGSTKAILEMRKPR